MTEDSERQLLDLLEQVAVSSRAAVTERRGRDLLDRLQGIRVAEVLLGSARCDEIYDEILHAAERVVGASASALLAVDATRGDLGFLAVRGGGGPDLRAIRVPMGEGFVGYVAVSGQPLAVSQASRDPRWAREVGRLVGYDPSTVLCVPVVRAGRVVGVLELLDKVGGSFDDRDIATLQLFARIAGCAAEMAIASAALATWLEQTLDSTNADREAVAAPTSEKPLLLDLAGKVARIRAEGDRARTLLAKIVEAIHGYVERPVRRG